MKFALVNNVRQEALKGITGSCPTCGQIMIAKCGNKMIHHWSHKGKLECDPWWENETEWHRAWKNYFNNEWQEISHVDPTSGEIHRADVKTPKQLVIEFQNSPINTEEVNSRENFYQNMIWIVNGTRRTKDYEKFSSDVEWLSKLDGNANELVTENESFRCSLLKEWSQSRIPVFFDFNEAFLWALLPKQLGRTYFFKINKESLLNSLTNDEFDNLKKYWQGSIDKYEWYLRRMAEQRNSLFFSIPRRRR